MNRFNAPNDLVIDKNDGIYSPTLVFAPEPMLQSWPFITPTAKVR